MTNEFIVHNIDETRLIRALFGLSIDELARNIQLNVNGKFDKLYENKKE